MIIIMTIAHLTYCFQILEIITNLLIDFYCIRFQIGAFNSFYKV